MLQAATEAEQWIEFVGGPFDGYQQPLQLPTEQLATDVVWLVTEDAFRQLDLAQSVKSEPGGVLKSVALYALDLASELLKYRYAGSIGPKAFSDAMHDFK